MGLGVVETGTKKVAYAVWRYGSSVNLDRGSVVDRVGTWFVGRRGLDRVVHLGIKRPGSCRGTGTSGGPGVAGVTKACLGVLGLMEAQVVRMI